MVSKSLLTIFEYKCVLNMSLIDISQYKQSKILTVGEQKSIAFPRHGNINLDNFKGIPKTCSLAVHSAIHLVNSNTIKDFKQFTYPGAILINKLLEASYFICKTIFQPH